MEWQVLITILLMGLVTYTTRIIGYLLLRNRQFSPRVERMMEAIPGCVLISVIAPVIVSGKLAESLAVIITCVAMMRLSILPTVLIAIASTGILRAIFG